MEQERGETIWPLFTFPAIFEPGTIQRYSRFANLCISSVSLVRDGFDFRGSVMPL
jgi:hypothetical protein